MPLDGRSIKDAHQGNVFHAIDLVRQQGGYQPVESESTPSLECSKWEDKNMHVLELCLFDGKHSLKIKHLLRALQLFLKD